MCDEDLLYRWFGIDAELLIDHAWGREPVTIADIRSYESKSKSLSSSQVLMRDYRYEEAEVIVKEMMDQLCMDLTAQKYVTDSVSLFVGYSLSQGVFGTGGSVRLTTETNVAGVIVPEVAKLYRRITNPILAIRRIGLSCNDVREDTNELQLNMFEDVTKQLQNKALQDTILAIRAKYGKNSILKGVNYEEAATGRARNTQIGGHRGGKNDN